jgi:hypothetical protein
MKTPFAAVSTDCLGCRLTLNALLFMHNVSAGCK